MFSHQPAAGDTRTSPIMRRQADTSAETCAGRQKMCASSCWNRRTRVSPVSAAGQQKWSREELEAKCKHVPVTTLQVLVNVWAYAVTTAVKVRKRSATVCTCTELC